MNNYLVEDVVPHKAPMILISRLVSYDANAAVCEVDISKNSAFFEAKINGVPSYIGTEYMAQSIAAYGGANALDVGKEVKIGLLIGSRKYQTMVPMFPVDATININLLKLIEDESGLCVFECSIKNIKGEILAAANLNVFQPDDPLSFLGQKYDK